MSVRTGNEAQFFARQEIAEGKPEWFGLCQKFVRTCFGVGGGFASAIKQWKGSKNKHATTDLSKIPKNVPIFWSGGKHGHVAIYIGDGKCISTDVKRKGRPDVVLVSDIPKKWGSSYQLLGWTEDLNGTQVYRKGTEQVKKPRRVGGDSILGAFNLYKLEKEYKVLCRTPSNPRKKEVGARLEKERASLTVDFTKRLQYTAEGDLNYLQTKQPGRRKTIAAYKPLVTYLDWLVKYKSGQA